jgi:hypothetical protein
MYLRLPGMFFHFWYLEAPKELFLYLRALNNTVAHMLSIPLFLRTFFKPLKNEYRGDLVGFSIGMGMAVKSVLLLASLFLFTVFLLFEIAFYLLFLALPLLTVLAVFIHI